MFSTPVNAEFSPNKPNESSEVDHVAVDKQQDNSTSEPKLDTSTGSEATKPVDLPKDTAETKAVAKKSNKVKAVPKSKTKGQPAVKKDVKKTVKTPIKQADIKDTNSASTQSNKVAPEKDLSVSGSQSSKDEL